MSSSFCSEGDALGESERNVQPMLRVPKFSLKFGNEVPKSIDPLPPQSMFLVMSACHLSPHMVITIMMEILGTSQQQTLSNSCLNDNGVLKITGLAVFRQAKAKVTSQSNTSNSSDAGVGSQFSKIPTDEVTFWELMLARGTC